ncbi:MAG TPA: hypothetical protein VKZ46_01400 [Pedomonas sp.]|nr:hypothetical protein [Pedomonas sp.]
MTDRYENIRKALAMLAEHAGATAVAEAIRAATTIRELLAARDQLAAALEAAREDAERYRWLRQQWEGAGWDVEPKTLDAAIDQARGKGGAG